ncbi:hypothetical protein TNCT_127431 [Trichonephila clavata]|uniref:Uncharacterized protein n=1 Tax=Trichonephila clavata TaxID=2740835 RepID=A0A8X6HY49_TRICU|nr:hypothetical protein TNCT_127431 [Trichonephila clavata]
MRGTPIAVTFTGRFTRGTPEKVGLSEPKYSDWLDCEYISSAPYAVPLPVLNALEMPTKFSVLVTFPTPSYVEFCFLSEYFLLSLNSFNTFFQSLCVVKYLNFKLPHRRFPSTRKLFVEL